MGSKLNCTCDIEQFWDNHSAFEFLKGELDDRLAVNILPDFCWSCYFEAGETREELEPTSITIRKSGSEVHTKDTALACFYDSLSKKETTFFWNKNTVPEWSDKMAEAKISLEGNIQCNLPDGRTVTVDELNIDGEPWGNYHILSQGQKEFICNHAGQQVGKEIREHLTTRIDELELDIKKYQLLRRGGLHQIISDPPRWSLDEIGEQLQQLKDSEYIELGEKWTKICGKTDEPSFSENINKQIDVLSDLNALNG